MGISKISIITAAYNRSGLLNDLYESLVKQTNQNFEWIVIDDGSIDDTVDVMTTIIDRHSANFNIEFRKQPNGGKHRAINEAMRLATGEVTFLVDSDDVLVETAIAKVISNWYAYYLDDRVSIVSFLRISRNGNLLGKFEDAPTHGPLLDLKYRQNVKGDFAETIRTSILKQLPFPEYPSEKFMSEGWLFKTIALLGKWVVMCPEAIYIADYLEGGLTKSGIANRLNYPNGMLLNSDLNLRVFTSLKEIIKNILLYDIYFIQANYRYGRANRALKSPYRVGKVVLYPVAAGLVCYWNRKKNTNTELEN